MKLPLVEDMLRILTARFADFETAKKAVRSLCVWWGGQQLYIPRFKKELSKTAEEMRGVLADVLGDGDAEIALSELMSKFGGFSHYIPQEKCAFQGDIAAEIYEKYNGTTDRLSDICREYGMSFTQVYRLWHRARDEKKQLHFDFEDLTAVR